MHDTRDRYANGHREEAHQLAERAARNNEFDRLRNAIYWRLLRFFETSLVPVHGNRPV